MSSEFELRDARLEDAEALTEIYNHFVLNTWVTFDLDPKPAEYFREQLRAATLPWLVCTEGDQVVAYSYASPWKSRCAYERTVESTVYVTPDYARRGIGVSLYRELLARLEEAGTHTVLGGIAVPNDPSIALHKKLGFEQVGRLREVGRKFERWIDVEYWQKLLGQP